MKKLGNTPASHIITGQRIDPKIAIRAKELRQSITPEEKILWAHLRANRLGGWHFRRQQIISGFIVDFYCHKAGLVIEVDGPVHEKQAEYDLQRELILGNHGLYTLRIKNEEIQDDVDAVLSRIRRASEREK